MVASSYRFGLLAELVTKLYLRLKLYNVIEERYRNYSGEIDLIATRGKTIVFVEVKARKTNTYEVLTFKQRKRITNAASIFVASKPKYHNYNLRFDLIIIRPWKWPVHLVNAW
ncbi:MAG: YraN family protein [Alphaproteobacteria bacterium]